MKPIQIESVQSALENFLNKEIYLHLETTNGAYAAHKDEMVMTVGAYFRNGVITFHHARISGNGPFRVGLKLEFGWVYAEGLTDFELDEKGRLLLAGHDRDGKLAVALQLSDTPF